MRGINDIIAITLNPSVDVATSVDRVQPTHKLRCEQPLFFPGGGAVNVARVAVRLGANVKLIYPSGGATGLLLRRLVDREGIPSVAVGIREETREDFTVFEKTTGEEFRFVMPGPHLDANEWQSCLDTFCSMRLNENFVVASGSLPPGVPDDFYARLATITKQAGGYFILDTSGEPLAAALAAGVHLVKPNLRELKALCNLKSEDEASIVEASRAILRRRGAEIVAVSLGELGALVVTRETAWRACAPVVKVISAVGAGDSFLGAMVWAMASGKALPEALQYGLSAGTASVLTMGTALCEAADVRRLFAQVRVEKIGIAEKRKSA